MVVHGNNYSGFDRLIEQAEQQKAEHLKERLSKSQWVEHSYDAASDWLDENPINADDVRLKALSQMSMPATEVVISWPRLTGRAKALADLVFTYISRSTEQMFTEIVKPRKRSFPGYAPVPLSYFDASECAKKIVTDEFKRQKDVAESEVLECCINSLPSLVDTCNRKPQTALNSVLAVAYGAAVKPVFPVTEAEHRSSLKNWVRSAAKTKGQK